MTKSYTANDLEKLARLKFGKADRYAVFAEVADGTGFARSWIDLAIVSLWPSDGLTRKAIEIKVSRSDFLRELDKPMKNQWARDSFHEFWFLTPKNGVLTPEELPDGAGWMYPRGDQLCVGRAARRNQTPDFGEDLVASFARSSRKELERAKREMMKVAKASDPEFLEGLEFKKATTKFLNSRNQRAWSTDSEDELIEKLEAATLDSEMAERREVVITRLDNFQNSIFNLFESFCVLAQVSLAERDDLGEFIAKQFGGKDEFNLAVLRAAGKTKPGKKDRHKSIVAHHRGVRAEAIGSVLDSSKRTTSDESGGR